MTVSEQTMADALKAADQYLRFVEATLNSVPVPSGQPAVARAFCDIRQATVITRAALRAVPGLRG